MADIDDRLFRCISSAFPGLTDLEIRTGAIEQLADVDSLAAVTLVALIDEEFGIDVDLEGLLNFGNFAGLRHFLSEQSAPNEAVKRRG